MSVNYGKQSNFGDIECVTIMEERYPSLLKEIKDPPKILYYIGDLSLAYKICVSVVGTRKPTPYGRWAAVAMGRTLGESGVVTVSGLADGVDTLAHKGAMGGQGKTIAVLGNGPDICFPAKNFDIMKLIAKEGLILSEYAPGVHGSKFTFPARNRIISGLSIATVIIEAGLSSGSLITAERAIEQGRHVYALPGNINNIYSIGANKLILDGAKPLIVLENLLEDLGIEKVFMDSRKEALGDEEKKVFNFVESGGETTVDQMVEALQIEAGAINGLVTVLEMKGMVYTSMGKIFVAK
jgi:DNA processing protein